MRHIKVLFIVQTRDDRSISGVGYIPIGIDCDQFPYRLVNELYREIREENSEIKLIGNFASSACLSAGSSRYIEERAIEVCHRLGITFGGMF